MIGHEQDRGFIVSSDLPLIIVNPKSGRGLSQREWASYAADIRMHFGAFECEFTKKSGEASEIAEREAKMGRKLIIGFGGDGTLSDIATGILRSGAKSELGLLHHGSGGDLRKTLGIPSPLWEAARRLRDGSTRLMDVGKVEYINHQGEKESRYFINVASFGMGGQVATRANRSSKPLGGKVAFANALLQTTFQYDLADVYVKIGSEEERRYRITNVCIANARYFGGGMKIAPDAKVDDGLFDVVTIGDFSTAEMVLHSYRLYLGTHLNLDKVAFARATRVEARPAQEGHEVTMEVDGETPGRLPAVFELIPQALAVRC
jgi:YegS/Rv2252/BmrU family lipid kinase